MTKDSSIPMLGYVYLIILEDTFKIGRTANFMNRYNKSTRDKAISIVPVTNPELVEQELINRFHNEDYSISKGREYFKGIFVFEIFFCCTKVTLKFKLYKNTPVSPPHNSTCL